MRAVLVNTITKLVEDVIIYDPNFFPPAPTNHEYVISDTLQIGDTSN